MRNIQEISQKENTGWNNLNKTCLWFQFFMYLWQCGHGVFKQSLCIIHPTKREFHTHRIPDKHSTHYYFIHIRFLMCIAILENMRPRHASYFSKLVYMQLCVKCSETILFNSMVINVLLRDDLLFIKWYWKRNCYISYPTIEI